MPPRFASYATTKSSLELVRNSGRTFVRSTPPRLGEFGRAKVEIHAENVARVSPTADGCVLYVGKNLGFPLGTTPTEDLRSDPMTDGSDSTTADKESIPTTRE